MITTSIDCTPILGTPFLSGGEEPRRGMDCWGVARWCAARGGLALPRLERGVTLEEVDEVAGRWARVGCSVAHAGELLDVAACRLPRDGMHAAILVSPGERLWATVYAGGTVRLAAQAELRGVVAIYRHAGGAR